MAKTYEPIATTTLGSAQSSITFSSIPSTYTDLILVAGSLGMNNAGSAGKVRFNGDTGSNYSDTVLLGTGSSASSYREANANNIRVYGFNVGPTGSGNNDNVIVHIQNYANSTTYKTVVCRSNITQVELAAVVGLWRSTSAITSVTFVAYNGTDTFTTGSTFTLYGIKAA